MVPWWKNNYNKFLSIWGTTLWRRLCMALECHKFELLFVGPNLIGFQASFGLSSIRICLDTPPLPIYHYFEHSDLNGIFSSQFWAQGMVSISTVLAKLDESLLNPSIDVPNILIWSLCYYKYDLLWSHYPSSVFVNNFAINGWQPKEMAWDTHG